MAKELTYEMREDMDNKTLLKLKNFLQLPELKETGITPENCSEHSVPAPLHIGPTLEIFQ